MSLVLQAVPFKQGRVQMYLAIVHVGDLERFSVAVWNPNSPEGKRGYQRSPNKDRIKSIARYMERANAIMPVAGLVNIRDRGLLKYRSGRVTIPDGTSVWVVDMQHRMKGLIQAHEEGAIKSSFEFPIVMTEGLSALDEAAQFYVINTKAKKMDISLTRRLLIENNRVRDISGVKPWEVAAVRITIALNQRIRNNPWFGAIRRPNEEKLRSHIATEKSFVTSLRQMLLRDHRQWNAKAKRLAAFWNAIEENVPEPFQDPKSYLLQRTPGIFAFNFFLAPVLMRVSERQLVRRLAGLQRLPPNFWRRTNPRGARRFGTGMGGYANLADYIQEHL